MAENNNNENLNEVERPTIAELKVRATGIKEETTEGANTAERVGGLMYDMIDVLDANMEQMAGDTLKEPLKTINAAGLGIPSNDKFLAYKNNLWTYVDLSTIVSSVDWSNITNKPNLNSLPYLADSTPYGAGLSCSDGAIYLKDQNGNVLAYADISSGGGGGGSDAYAVRYIPSGQNAGNVKLPVNSQGDYKKGNLWANSIIIGSADTIYGSIAKSASTNDIIFDNNLNGGIFEFDKSIATMSSKIILGNRSSKKVEISIPSGSGITDKLDINTFTYVTDTGYTQDTGGSIYLNGVAIGSGGGGGGGLTSGSWAAFFDLNTKDSGDTTGYLYLNNDGVSLEDGPSGGLTAATAGGQNVVATGTTTAAIPVADATHYGVIKINPAASLSTNQYPVKLSSGVAYVEVSGSGGGWTPTGGTTSNPKVATGDIENKAITNAKIDDSTIQYEKLHDNVGDVYINATSLNNLLTALDRINVSLIKQLDSVNHNFVFWAPPVHYTGQTFGTDAMYLYYSGNIICREGTVNNPIFYYNGSTLQVCVDGTRNKIWRFDTSSGPVQSSVICYDDDVSTGGGLTLAINGKIYSWSWNATPRKTVSNGCTLDVTKYL